MLAAEFEVSVESQSRRYRLSALGHPMQGQELVVVQASRNLEVVVEVAYFAGLEEPALLELSGPQALLLRLHAHHRDLAALY